MSMGNSPADRAIGKRYSQRLMAKADADRAARLAGHKSLFWRLLERLRPHRSVDTRVGDRTRSDPSVASGVFVPVVHGSPENRKVVRLWLPAWLPALMTPGVVTSWSWSLSPDLPPAP
jgi:hypothetical protein